MRIRTRNGRGTLDCLDRFAIFRDIVAFHYQIGNTDIDDGGIGSALVRMDSKFYRSGGNPWTLEQFPGGIVSFLDKEMQLIPGFPEHQATFHCRRFERLGIPVATGAGRTISRDAEALAIPS